MKNKTFIAALLLVVCGIAAVVLVSLNKPGTSISFSETEDDVTILASFPNKDSDRVHRFIKSQLKLNDLSDLSGLEIKHYDTPDQVMRVYIKSRDGYLKIVLDKDRNSPAAIRQLRETCEGLKKVLAKG